MNKLILHCHCPRNDHLVFHSSLNFNASFHLETENQNSQQQNIIPPVNLQHFHCLFFQSQYFLIFFLFHFTTFYESAFFALFVTFFGSLSAVTKSAKNA